METTESTAQLVSHRGDWMRVDTAAGPLEHFVTFAPGERWKEITVSLRGLEQTFMVERVESLPGSGALGLWDAKVRAVRMGPAWLPL